MRAWRSLIGALIVGTVAGVGCDKKAEPSNQPPGSAAKSAPGGATDPATASDDDLLRADARAEGKDEAGAVLLWHQHKNEDAGRYFQYMKQLRHRIKYYGGPQGTTTLEEYVQKRLAERAASKAEEEAFRRQGAERASRSARQDADRQAKERKVADIVNRYAAEAKKLDAEYRPRIKALDDAHRLDDASALTTELANKREALQKRQNDEINRVSSGS